MAKYTNADLETKLSTEEFKKVLNDINKVFPSLINQLVAIADKHNVKRDDLIAYFEGAFSAMTKISTFEDWRVRTNEIS